ncbi:MAG: LuxR C-terminal-related transcriptional regulator [Pseudomonadota bacterium]|nr:LuxR C-terminal-related transcriptional regulator [Pseudomonadota bacterium]
MIEQTSLSAGIAARIIPAIGRPEFPSVLLSVYRDAVLEWARGRGLSAREAQVVTGLTLGQTQAQIAGRVGLSVNSVITYRRRAYQKLAVADRRALQALCERQLAQG